ncbi:MAG: pitrilysin family protein [Phycisphaerales bacterium]
MPEIINTYKLRNGMTVIGIEVPAVQSAAFEFLIPSGASVMPEGTCGAPAVIEDWIFRGAGGKSSRELNDLLDGMGMHRGSSVDSSHLTLAAALQSENLSRAIDLYADVILRPALDNQQFEYSRQLALQGLMSLDDNPRHKIMLLLREHFYPDPLGRNTVGKQQDLQNLTDDKCKQIINDNFDISNCILAVAGKIDFDKLCLQAEKLFASENKKISRQISPSRKPLAYHHYPYEGAQVHIGIMTDSVTPDHEEYYNARLAVAVLSGGMSSRLFTEVREKRGLCYSVGASYHTLKEIAGIGCYAGTTPDKAQQTYDVIISEFKKLSEGIAQEELNRAKIGLQSLLVMQSESTIARVGAAASDYYMLGKVKTLDEIKKKIENTTVDTVVNYLKKNPFEKFCAVTLGPTEIKFEI